MTEPTRGWIPQAFLDDPSQFGRIDSPTFRSPRDLEEAGQLAISIAQHNAARIVLQRIAESSLTQRELARRLGRDEGYFNGQLTGRYSAGYDDLARWALLVDDVSTLVVFDSLDAIRPE